MQSSNDSILEWQIQYGDGTREANADKFKNVKPVESAPHLKEIRYTPPKKAPISEVLHDKELAVP